MWCNEKSFVMETREFLCSSCLETVSKLCGKVTDIHEGPGFNPRISYAYMIFLDFISHSIRML